MNSKNVRIKTNYGRRLVLAAVMLLAAVLMSAPALAYSYTTEDYQVDIKVNENNTYQVEESIDVNFYTDKHGIFRYIPVGRYKNMGYMSIGSIDVEGWDFEAYTEDGNKVIQIGHPDKTVTGRNSYEISYKIKIYDDGDESRDVLYLDVIPTGWETPIEKASVTMTLPKDIDENDIDIFRGRYGATVESGIDWSYDSESRKLKITARDLAQGEGITVFTALPEGYWQGEATFTWAKVTAIILCFAIPGVLALLWFAFGRDKKIVPTVEFYPPAGMTPAEVGYIIDGTVNQKDLLSLLIYFAEKGYLTIEQKGKKEFEIKKIKDIDDKEKRFAKTLFEGLFKGGDVVNPDELDEEFGESYLTAYSQLNDYFNKKSNRQTSVKSLVFQILGIVLLAAAQILSLALASWYSGEIGWAVLSGIMAAVGLVFLIVAIFRNKKLYAMKNVRKYVGGTVLWVVTAVILAAFGFAMGHMLNASYIGLLMAAALLGGYVCVVLMRQRTKKNIELMGKVLGLKNFIETAELNRINTLVEENPSYFYDVLPYAYVMGLTDKWAENFEKIKIKPPAWYNASYGRLDIFDVWFMSRMMNQCGRTFAGNIKIPAGGDSGVGGGFSGGGGGFSGGGFGGGGGGSW